MPPLSPSARSLRGKEDSFTDLAETGSHSSDSTAIHLSPMIAQPELSGLRLGERGAAFGGKPDTALTKLKVACRRITYKYSQECVCEGESLAKSLDAATIDAPVSTRSHLGVEG